MEIDGFSHPRRFQVGVADIELSHVANIVLEPDEMITLISAGNREYDVTAKDWGYYATPSVRKRLKQFGMRAGMMRNLETGDLFVVLVFEDKVAHWRRYMEIENQELISWLDEME